MKTSVSIYSYNAELTKKSMTPIDCIRHAKQTGFDAIEFVDMVFKEISDPLSYADELRLACEQEQIAVSNYAVGADLLCDDPDTVMEGLKRNVDIAERLGSKFMRHDISSGAALKKYEGYASVVDTLAKRCNIVSEYAKTKGIRTMTENHGYFSQDSTRVEMLVNAVKNENFGLLVDIGNFLCAGESSEQAVGRVAPYAFFVHVKDFIVKSGNELAPGRGFFPSRSGDYLRGTVLGHGDVKVLQCLRALHRVGYSGYVSLEFEGIEPCCQAIEISHENLTKYIHLLS